MPTPPENLRRVGFPGKRARGSNSGKGATESVSPKSDCADKGNAPAAPLPGNDKIQSINFPAALVEEALAMSHCVHNYAERVVEGDTYLYRVLADERATLSITLCGTLWQIDPLAGVQNQRSSIATEDLVRSWLLNTQTTLRNA